MLAALLLLIATQTSPPPTPIQGATVACVGDSITAGARLKAPGHHAWPAQLRARLNVDSGYERFTVHACGVGGATLLREGDTPIWRTDAFERIVTQVDYQHVVVLLGTNDTVAGARGNWARSDAWEIDLEALVARLRERRQDARILLVGPPPMFPNARGLAPARVADLQERAPRIRELQRRTRAFAEARPHVTHCDLEGILLERHVVDGVHPGPFGHEAIARAVHSTLAEELGDSFGRRAALVPAPSAEHRAGAGWQGGTWWEAFERLRALGRAHPDTRVVFLGDSITQGLTGDRDRVARTGGSRAIDRAFGADGALVLGLSGDRTEHLRFRIRRGALRSMSPRVVVLQVGINNLQAAGHAPRDVIDGIRAVVDDLRATQPWATILVCGPFPAGRTADDALRRAVDAVHEGIASIEEGTESDILGGRAQVRYLDLRPTFLSADGTPGPEMAGDALHVSEAGRVAWMEFIEPHVRAELDRPMAPGLPTEIAWLVEGDDYPLVSRSLVTLSPGDPGPRRRVQPILYSFDAHDLSNHAGAADGSWVFTGPILEHRSAPNVSLPLHALAKDGEVRTWPIDAWFFAIGPEGRRVAACSESSLSIVDLSTGRHRELLGADVLRSTMWNDVEWGPERRIVLEIGAFSERRPGELTSGRWAVDPETGALEQLRRGGRPNPPGPSRPSASLDRGDARSVQHGPERDGWVLALRVEQDGTRTVAAVRLEPRAIFPLGPGLRARWAHAATDR